MRTIKILLILLLALNSAIANQGMARSTASFQPGSDDVFEAVNHFYEYDRNIPFDAKIVETRKIEYGTREKIVFTGLFHIRVPSFLATPNDGKEKHPLIFLVNPSTGTKENWFQRHPFHQGIAVTNILLQAGFAVMTLDAAYHGERSAENDYARPPKRKEFRYTKRDMDIQTVKEYRRAMDYLETRVDIDTSRMGMMGFSMGSMVTSRLSTIETRVKVAVIVAAPTNDFPNRIQAEAFMMVVGNRNPKAKNRARAIFDLIPSAQKKFVDYDSAHPPPPEYIDEVSNWFIQHLK